MSLTPLGTVKKATFPLRVPNREGHSTLVYHCNLALSHHFRRCIIACGRGDGSGNSYNNILYPYQCLLKFR